MFFALKTTHYYVLSPQEVEDIFKSFSPKSKALRVHAS
jgi:hypothetical protein